MREAARDGSAMEVHVFERWSHIGTARNDDDLVELAETRVEIDFDPDVYAILSSYLARHRGAARPLTRAPAAIPM